MKRVILIYKFKILYVFLFFWETKMNTGQKLTKQEQEKLDSFLTMKIEEAFNLFSIEKGYISLEYF